jgi:sucrose phosphorylase
MNVNKIHDLLVKVYGEDAGTAAFEKTTELLHKYKARIASQPGGLDQRDTILITYADQVQQPGQHPLSVLADFCRLHLQDTITGIHILPFYPWTSDDGFSVVDYQAVDERYGTWDDIDALGEYFRLMLDAVVNHVSMKSTWFQGLLSGDPQYQDYFISPNETDDLSRVVRPRALPLLTTFQTVVGEKKIWTTFSADQVDLNYGNPNVLLEILDVLLLYVSHGAEFIRLDAIAYLWKESGTSCIHLPQTHWIIQLFRAVLDEVAPQVMLITETNVPHQDNISYFGNGTNEAQMVYNFSLPPLVLHAFQTGSAETLSHWADELTLPSEKVTFFNFLASHDGIGLNPLRGILPESEIEQVIQRVQSHNGLVSYKSDVDGTQRAYELNINYFDVLNNPNIDEDLDTQVDRVVTAHAILLAMRGVPALYFHSLFGSRGWPEGAIQSGHHRTINRKKFQREELEKQLALPGSRESRVFERLGQLLKIRREHPAFDPFASQDVFWSVPELFGLLRTSNNGREKILCLHNVSQRSLEVDISFILQGKVRDLISNRLMNDIVSIPLEPYQTLWLI